MIQIAELINHFVNGIVNMAKIKKVNSRPKPVTKIKKAQTGTDTTKARKVITEKEVLNEWRPTNVERMRGGAYRPQASDSLINQRIKEGVIRRDPKSGDIFPTEKYYKPGRKLSGELKKGGKVVKKAVKLIKKSIKKK